jgi:hypothetical protein
VAGQVGGGGAERVAGARQPASRGSWTRRYEHGVPVTDDGTTVRFRPDDSLAPVGALVVDVWPRLRVVVDDRWG